MMGPLRKKNNLRKALKVMSSIAAAPNFRKILCIKLIASKENKRKGPLMCGGCMMMGVRGN